MKKINVLDLLCDDFKATYDKEQENIKSVIKENEYNTFYQHNNIFLSNNYKMLNLDFEYNIDSTDNVEKAKSLCLLNDCIVGSIHLIGATPGFFKHYEKEFNRSMAFDEIIFRVLLGNILDYKQELKTIKQENATTYIEKFSKLYQTLKDKKYKPF